MTVRTSIDGGENMKATCVWSEIVNLMRLVAPESIPYRRRGEPGVLRYVLETCPDHLII